MYISCQYNDLLVLHLRKVIVEVSDRAERFRRRDANDFVDLIGQPFANWCRSDGNGNRDLRGLELSQGTNARQKARASGYAVVDENDRLSSNGDQYLIAARGLFATPHFFLFSGRNGLNVEVRDPKGAYDLLVKDANPSGRDRSEGKLFVTGDAEFSKQEHIERSMKRAQLRTRRVRRRREYRGQRHHFDGHTFQVATPCSGRIRSDLQKSYGYLL